MFLLMFAFIAIVIVTSFASFLVSPFIAWKKRYSPYYWLFACGPIGLAVIICLPSLKSAPDPETLERLEHRANLIGGTLSFIGIFLGFIPVFAMVASIGF